MRTDNNDHLLQILLSHWSHEKHNTNWNSTIEMIGLEDSYWTEHDRFHFDHLDYSIFSLFDILQSRRLLSLDWIETEFQHPNVVPFVDSISNRQIHLTLIKLREELNSGISITRIDMCINDKVQSKGRIGIIQHSSIPLFPFHYWYIIFMNSIDHINVIIEFIRNRTVGDNSNSTLEW